jgi:hypothetical protein
MRFFKYLREFEEFEKIEGITPGFIWDQFTKNQRPKNSFSCTFDQWLAMQNHPAVAYSVPACPPPPAQRTGKHSLWSPYISRGGDKIKGN